MPPPLMPLPMPPCYARLFRAFRYHYSLLSRSTPPTRYAIKVTLFCLMLLVTHQPTLAITRHTPRRFFRCRRYAFCVITLRHYYHAAFHRRSILI